MIGRSFSFRNRDGATLVLMAVVMLGTLAILALAIDFGMLLTARSEAQRTADAAALAGASVWMEVTPPLNIVGEATTRAMDLANANFVRNQAVPAAAVTIDVIEDSMKVRVQIRRTGLATWFARLIGVNQAAVWAKAAANVELGGAARCFAPFAIPDMWSDASDPNNNNIWEPGETWIYEPPADRYQTYTEGDPTSTGYGSSLRDGIDPRNGEKVVDDFGRLVVAKITDPQDTYGMEPSVFYPWRIPLDPTQTGCQSGGKPGAQGASAFKANICSCNKSPVELGTDYPIETGNMVGPAYQGMQELINQDPTAVWKTDYNGKGYVDSKDYPGDNWINSPRVMRVAMFNPGEITGPGMQYIKFSNFGMLFLEEQQSMKDPIVGRFLPFSAGDDLGPTQGSLVRILRLVE